MDTIQQIWGQIEAWMEIHAPRVLSLLPTGCTEKALIEFEKKLQMSLSDDFKTSCLRHDGGFSVHLATPMKMLSINESITIWTEQ